MATSALPSASSLIQNSLGTTEEWFKSSRTKKGYRNYVKSSKTWLADWTAEGRLDNEILADAFDVISEQTPLALRTLTAYKCKHLERGFSTAEGLRSAFKDYFERVCGCQGDFWKYNSHTQKWEGNPVFESGFKTYYESLKNHQNRTGTATQALPMLPSDLKIIMKYLDSEEAIKYFTVTQWLYFKVFVTTAFTLWTRNDELINLQFKDVKLNLRSKTGIPYDVFSLIFRKTNKDPTKVQKYMVQSDLAHPEIDCYTHVVAWKTHMEGLLGRALTGADYVFPTLASTGQIKFGECTSRSGFETLLDEVVDKSNADRKWSLKAVKWWRGWSSNENVGTLMRYLLDELMAYEEGFSDIMMDDHTIDRHETFMGQDETALLSKADLSKFEDSILVKIQGMIAGAPVLMRTSANVFVLPTPQIGTAPNAHAGELQPTNTCSANDPPDQQAPVTPPAYIPRPSRIPEVNTLHDALMDWELGSPQRGLDVPLKDWPTLFRSSEYASEAVKLGNIRFVCEEFKVQCGEDHTTFETNFPGLRGKFTMLMKAPTVPSQPSTSSVPPARLAMTLAGRSHYPNSPLHGSHLTCEHSATCYLPQEWYGPTNSGHPGLASSDPVSTRPNHSKPTQMRPDVSSDQ
ncbi:hypothetical protein B0H13DRAFT_2370907 [Mycena leptocephala]|nr:hypothetical protein B0H13DRAFT_2370907 [Mycena leptocephala]